MEMAEAGRGNYYYLEEPSSAQRSFAKEIDELIRVIAQNISVEIKTPVGANLREAVNAEGRLTLDMYSGLTRSSNHIHRQHDGRFRRRYFRDGSCFSLFRCLTNGTKNCHRNDPVPVVAHLMPLGGDFIIIEPS